MALFSPAVDQADAPKVPARRAGLPPTVLPRRHAGREEAAAVE
jgi:hypothetical protein